MPKLGIANVLPWPQMPLSEHTHHLAKCQPTNLYLVLANVLGPPLAMQRLNDGQRQAFMMQKLYPWASQSYKLLDLTAPAAKTSEVGADANSSPRHQCEGHALTECACIHGCQCTTTTEALHTQPIFRTNDIVHTPTPLTWLWALEFAFLALRQLCAQVRNCGQSSTAWPAHNKCPHHFEMRQA